MPRGAGRERSGSRPLRTGCQMSDSTATEINRLAGAMLQELLRRTHLSAAPDLGAGVAEEAAAIGADSLVLYLLDHEQRCLVPVPGPGADARAPLPVQGTGAGRAFAANAIIDLDAADGGRRVWLPLLDGTERLGVAQMAFTGRDRPLSAEFAALCERYTAFDRDADLQQGPLQRLL